MKMEVTKALLSSYTGRGQSTVDFTVLTGALPITETWIEGKILSKEIDRTVSNK